MLLWFLLFLIIILILRRILLTSSWFTAMNGLQRKRFTVFAPKQPQPMVVEFFKRAGANFQQTGEKNLQKNACLAQRAWGGPMDWFFGDGVMTVQYWRSFEELAAHNKNSRHVSSTKHYWAELEDLGVVSIWHETYMLVPGAYENVFGNSHLIGLGAVPGATIVDIDSSSELTTAKVRIEEGLKRAK